MDLADIRSEAEALYLASGADPERPPGALWIAERVLRRVAWVDELEEPARLVEDPGPANDDARAPYCMELRGDLAYHQAQFFASHELGEYRITKGGWRSVVLAWSEHAATQIGVNALAPDQAVRQIVRVSGWGPRKVDLIYLARTFQITPPIGLLRLGEALNWPVVLVNREPLWEGRGGPTVQMRGEFPRRVSNLEAVRWAYRKTAPPRYRRLTFGARDHLVALLYCGD